MRKNTLNYVNIFEKSCFCRQILCIPQRIETPSSIGVLQDGVTGVPLDPLKNLGFGCLIILKNPEINIFFHIQI